MTGMYVVYTCRNYDPYYIIYVMYILFFCVCMYTCAYVSSIMYNIVLCHVYRYIRLRGETEPISELIKQQKSTQQQQQQYTQSQQGTNLGTNIHDNTHINSNVNSNQVSTSSSAVSPVYNVTVKDMITSSLQQVRASSISHFTTPLTFHSTILHHLISLYYTVSPLYNNRI